ncbi:MAG: YgiQ family radical SAM protein, partial [Candidatus Omnitrophota bacterium]
MKDFLPISKEDLKKRGWNELDIILVTGDAYVDHPSYGAALIGRVLESAGFKVGIIAQPDWRALDDFKKLGRPKLFFGVTAGNIDSMLAKYTANKKIRNVDDYSPGGRPLLRPERASIMYVNKLKEAFKGIPIVLGGIEASMRRLAHYDYWSDKV